MTDIRNLAHHAQVKLQDLFAIPTSEWPEGISIDTSHLGPRVTEQQADRLRLSYGIFCGRRQWYIHNEPEVSDTNQSPAMVQLCKFSIGDLWEAYAHQLMPHCLPEGYRYIDTGDFEVEFDGQKGHLDGLIVCPNGDLIVADQKHTSEFRVKKWENGMPDWEWGYRAQAQLYMWAVEKAQRDGRWPEDWGRGRVIGFMWPVSYSQKFGLWDLAVGWAYADDRELNSHGKLALRQWHDARTLDSPPPRWGETGICRYCERRDHCKNDLR